MTLIKRSCKKGFIKIPTKYDFTWRQIKGGGVTNELRPKSDVLLWTTTHGLTNVCRQGKTCLRQLCADTGRILENMQGAMDDTHTHTHTHTHIYIYIEREREREKERESENQISVQSEQLGEGDDNKNLWRRIELTYPLKNKHKKPPKNKKKQRTPSPPKITATKHVDVY